MQHNSSCVLLLDTQGFYPLPSQVMYFLCGNGKRNLFSKKRKMKQTLFHSLSLSLFFFCIFLSHSSLCAVRPLSTASNSWSEILLGSMLYFCLVYRVFFEISIRPSSLAGKDTRMHTKTHTHYPATDRTVNWLSVDQSKVNYRHEVRTSLWYFEVRTSTLASRSDQVNFVKSTKIM